MCIGVPMQNQYIRHSSPRITLEFKGRTRESFTHYDLIRSEHMRFDNPARPDLFSKRINLLGNLSRGIVKRKSKLVVNFIFSNSS